jgi:hypothetical protein
MCAQAVIAHQIPGRMRLLIPEKRGDAGYFENLLDEFSRVDAVQRAKVNPLTGSLTLEFTGDPGDILQHLGMAELVSAGPDGQVDSVEGSVSSRVLGSPMPATSPVNLVSGREVNPMFMVGSALGVVGLMQTFRGQVLAPAISVFWYAIEAFRQSGKNTDTT